jgi:hypothetical protein
LATKLYQVMRQTSQTTDRSGLAQTRLAYFL